MAFLGSLEPGTVSLVVRVFLLPGEACFKGFVVDLDVFLDADFNAFLRDVDGPGSSVDVDDSESVSSLSLTGTFLLLDFVMAADFNGFVPEVDGLGPSLSLSSPSEFVL